MANIKAVATGNWSNPATWDVGTLPTSADDVFANGFTITINGTFTVLTIRNTASPILVANIATPAMISNDLPSGVVFASSASGANFSWNAFSQDGTTTLWQSGTSNTGTLGYEFTSGKVIKRYVLRMINSVVNSFPTAWTFQGSNDGVSYTTLDTVTGAAIPSGGNYISSVLANTTSYTYYRINITAVNTAGTSPTIGEFEMTESTSAVIGSAAGGGFTFANGGDLTCVATDGIINRSVSNVYCLTFDLPSPSVATLRASASTAGVVLNGRNILVQNTGTFNMFGNYDLQQSPNGNRAIIFVNGSTIINIVGNITCSQTGLNVSATLWLFAGTPTINITGNVNGGATNNISFGNGILSSVASTINITGNITTNLTASVSIGGGTLNVTGNITAASGFPAIYSVTAAHAISVTGTVTASVTSAAIIMTNANSQVYLNGNMVNVNGRMAIFAPIVWLDRTGTTSAAFFTSGGGNRTLYSANTVPNTPAASNVRLGTIYGAGNSLGGTLAMPVAANTRNGVAYDNGTIGTALFTTATLLSELNSSSDSIAVRIRNAATPQILGELMEAYKR